MTYLLDVNVLIALVDTEHDFHEEAHDWFHAEGIKGWATCAITENAVLGIVGARSYLNTPGPPSRVAEMLDQVLALGRHSYWDDDIRMMTSRDVDRTALNQAGQITDLHLLALAARRGGKLATFDRRIRPDPVIGGANALVFLPRAN